MTKSRTGPPRVLVIAQPDSAGAAQTAALLRAEGIEPSVQGWESALETVSQGAFLCALCHTTGADSRTVFAQLQETAPALRVVLMGPSGDVRQAVLALRTQPFDYLELPITPPALRETLARAACEPDPRQARWLESLQALTPGLIHELRNPLSGVLAGSQLLGRLEQPAGGPSGEYARIVREEAQQLERHLSRLAEFGRLGIQHWGLAAEVDLAEVLARVLDRHRPECEARRARVNTLDGAGGARARGDSTRLAQAIGELFRNALEALPEEGGTVICRVRPSDQPGSAAGPVTERSWTEVVLTDDGGGLSEDARRRAFEPFFSTKPRALGIGLPLAQLIAWRHGGMVRLEPAAGGGAAAILCLPAPPVD